VATRTVTVVDATPPELTCPGDATVATNNGCAYVRPAGESTGATATDNCSAPTEITITSDAPGAFALGTTTVTWVATDESGNSTLCTQQVTVVDDTVPEITCPGLTIVNANAGCAYVGSIGDVTATDNCSATLRSDAPESFPLGDTTVTWMATDLAGNTATCEQVVRVVDSTPPTILCPRVVTVPCVSGDGAVAEFETVASDICTPDPRVVCTPASGTLFPLGRTTVTCTATDAAGNVATCDFDVVVTCSNLVLPGDCNSDGDVDISDALCLLGILFLGTGRELPCGDGSVTDAANEALMSWGSVPDIDLSDAVALLNWKFLGGPAHVMGSRCTPIVGCPEWCDVER